MFQTKVVEKIKTDLMFKRCLSKIVPLTRYRKIF